MTLWTYGWTCDLTRETVKIALGLDCHGLLDCTSFLGLVHQNNQRCAFQACVLWYFIYFSSTVTSFQEVCTGLRGHCFCTMRTFRQTGNGAVHSGPQGVTSTNAADLLVRIFSLCETDVTISGMAPSNQAATHAHASRVPLNV